MLMATQGPYALMVQPDDILISPREVDEHFGTMVCFHPRYALGDNHNYMDKDDFLREMYLNTVGNDERGMERYENMVNMVWSRKMTGPNPDERAVDNTMLNVISKKYIMLPLYLLDHSGLAMKTTSFHDPWDSGQIGWIYVSKEDALKEFGGEKMTGAIKKKAEDLMRSEVAASAVSAMDLSCIKTANWRIAAGALWETFRMFAKTWPNISRRGVKIWWNTWRNIISRRRSLRRS